MVRRANAVAHSARLAHLRETGEQEVDEATVVLSVGTPELRADREEVDTLRRRLADLCTFEPARSHPLASAHWILEMAVAGADRFTA